MNDSQGRLSIETGRNAAANGFSLLEVVVALVVASSLILTYISMQENSIAYFEDIESRLEHIEFAQNYLVDNPFYGTHVPTPDWAGNDPGRKWKIEVDRQSDNLRYTYLKTLNDESTMTWAWITR